MEDYPSPDADSTNAQMPPDADTKKAGEETMDAETTLVPSRMFGGEMPKPGTECTFKVVHCYEDECEVEYVGSKESKPEGEEEMHPMEKRMMPFADKGE
jgi:hypothetical protein